ncbi:phospholipase D-like domain-containing protein [Calothrix sp. NIES-3974]|uniref:phospholipase D-like domain-containing protein n=1 Tax=Calothrix sp. NIES-3974 TaxID=2005462 RepID=UPI000B61808F|nr:phospholipase D-like domain-containing protein [Calothrix sp. NIES-3974]BAZ06218.1 hypothetical protein NIES3974_28760 [Calothrix sp. NIES-3974]
MHYYHLFSRVFLLFTLTTILVGCQAAKSNIQREKSLPQDKFIQVYFNHSAASQYQDPYRKKTRLGDDLEQQIINTINRAEKTIDIAVQELRLPRIAQALVDKQKQGVKIRVILENNYSRPASSFSLAEIKKMPERERTRYQEYRHFIDINKDGKLSQGEINQRDALVIIANAKIPGIDDTGDGSKGSGLMHHKFVVVDNRFVVVTSANFTMSDVHGDYGKPGNSSSKAANLNSQSLGNANNLVIIDNVEVADIFRQEFDLMWGTGIRGNYKSKFGLQKPFRPPQTIQVGNNVVTINFSPISPTQPWESSSNGLIARKLEKANKSIDLALFVFSEQRLADSLQYKHQQNVRIRALFEPSFAFRYYSEALDLLGVARSHKCQYEPDNRPWSTPATVAIPQLARGDLLHHKFAVIDNQTVITGSHNWSAAANHNNDETVVIMKNPVVAAHFSQEIERLYGNSKPGLPDKVKARIAAEKQKCPQIQRVGSRE